MLRDIGRHAVDAAAVELDDLPRASPDAFIAVRTPLIDDGDLGLLQFDGVLRTDTDAAPAEIAFPGDDVDHQWRSSLHNPSEINRLE